MNQYHTNHKLSFFSCDTSHFLPAFAHPAQIGFSSEQRRFALLQPRHPRNDRIFFPSFAVGAIDDDYLGQARAIYTQGWRMTGIRYIIRVAVKMWMWWVDIPFWSKMQSLVSTRLCWREHILNLDFTGNLKSEESIRGKNSNTQILNEMIFRIITDDYSKSISWYLYLPFPSRYNIPNPWPFTLEWQYSFPPQFASLSLIIQ